MESAVVANITHLCCTWHCGILLQITFRIFQWYCKKNRRYVKHLYLRAIHLQLPIGNVFSNDGCFAYLSTVMYWLHWMNLYLYCGPPTGRANWRPLCTVSSKAASWLCPLQSQDCWEWLMVLQGPRCLFAPCWWTCSQGTRSWPGVAEELQGWVEADMQTGQGNPGMGEQKWSPAPGRPRVRLTVVLTASRLRSKTKNKITFKQSIYGLYLFICGNNKAAAVEFKDFRFTPQKCVFL